MAHWDIWDLWSQQRSRAEVKVEGERDRRGHQEPVKGERNLRASPDVPVLLPEQPRDHGGCVQRLPHYPARTQPWCHSRVEALLRGHGLRSLRAAPSLGLRSLKLPGTNTPLQLGPRPSPGRRHPAVPRDHDADAGGGRGRGPRRPSLPPQLTSSPVSPSWELQEGGAPRPSCKARGQVFPGEPAKGKSPRI